MALEQRIKQEIEDNPALEESGPDEDEKDEQDDVLEDSLESDEDEFKEETDDETSNDDDFSIEDYLSEDEIPEYKLYANNTSPDDETREAPLAEGISFQDFLLSQMGMHRVTDKQYIIASIIIGNLDEPGYLSGRSRHCATTWHLTMV